jgi:RNA polymerase sigma-70 factor (ECF subfamily)
VAYAKDVEGFRAFVRAEVAGLVRYAAGMDAGDATEAAEDAVHDVLFEALMTWSSIDNPGAWARTAVRRRYVSIRERQRERPHRESRTSPAVPQPTPEERMLRAEEEEFVRKALERLPPRQAEVFGLHYDGYSTAEIALIVGSSQNSVRSNLRHARRTLRELGFLPRDGKGTLGSEGGDA